LPRWASADDAARYADVEPGKAPGWFAEKLPGTKWQAVTVKDEAITPFKDATHYNNFYEFGTDKGDPAANAGSLKTEPWSVVIGWRGRKAGALRPGRLHEAVSIGRANLPSALCGGVVDGHSVDGFSHFGVAQAG